MLESNYRDINLYTSYKTSLLILKNERNNFIENINISLFYKGLSRTNSNIIYIIKNRKYNEPMDLGFYPFIEDTYSPSHSINSSISTSASTYIPTDTNRFIDIESILINKFMEINNSIYIIKWKMAQLNSKDFTIFNTLNILNNQLKLFNKVHENSIKNAKKSLRYIYVNIHDVYQGLEKKQFDNYTDFKNDIIKYPFSLKLAKENKILSLYLRNIVS
jgi:hypothetical protein